MTDDTPSPLPTRRQLREAERHQHTPSRRDLRMAAEAAHQAKIRQAAASGLPEDLLDDADYRAGREPASRPVSHPLSTSPTEQTPLARSGSRAPAASPAAPPVSPVSPPVGRRADFAPHTTTLPVTTVVEHDGSLDVSPTPLTLPRRVRPPATTHTFPVTIAPRAAKARPLQRKTGGQRILTWAVMVSAPLLFIGVSMPVNLFYSVDNIAPAIAVGNEDGVDESLGQAFIVDSAPAEITAISRESWSVNSYAEVLRSRYGGRSYNYAVGQGGAIRWPFPVAVPISSGFGNRVAPCRYCSSYHRGIDFVPGSGAPTYAMAEGVVTQSEFSGGYGQHVYIEHRLNGQSVLTVYAHLQRNSSPLRVGDRVEVGGFVGLVGSTGTSTGAHLHFEVRIDGVYVDPFAYLTANTG